MGDHSNPADIYLTSLDAALLADIVGHPYQLPTVDELAYTNQRADRATIRHRLRVLTQQGVVELVEFDENNPSQDDPAVFFGITELGQELLFRRMPDATEQTLHRLYSQLEKPQSIQKLERAPRPTRR